MTAEALVWIQLAALLAAQGTSPPATSPAGFSFAVLGHLRGDPLDGITNYLLPELVGDVRRTGAELVFLTGDMIWGDVHDERVDGASIVRQWEALDAALGALGVPIHRVPGNHDFHDVVTRDIYRERYGLPPAAVDYRGCRFLLLRSAWLPPDGYVGRPRGARGRQLEREQIEFIQRQLSDPGAYEHAFVFMHHLLWWEPDADWWRAVHPVLVGRKVRAVFSGEYGPYKFSHLRRDGIDYVQAAIENPPRVDMMRALESSRILSQQLDVYLLCHVDGPDVRIEVRPVGALTSGNYSPQRWRDVNAYRGRYMEYVYKAASRYPVRVVCGMLALGVAVGLPVGLLLGRRGRRRTA